MADPGLTEMEINFGISWTLAALRLLFVLAVPAATTPAVQSDGVYCFSRLEWLCHTLGHEMIHCIVHNACPQSRDMLAYAYDNGHGPVFRRLNR